MVALGVGTRCDENGEENVVAPILERLGYKLERAKTNIGLGRITNVVEAAKHETVGAGTMTNTLHRFGERRELSRRLRCVRDCQPRQERRGRARRSCGNFCEMAVTFKPVNLGDARHGGALRPCRTMNPPSHWNRDMTPDFEAVIEGLDHITTGRGGVRQSRRRPKIFVKAVKERGSRAEHQYLDLDRWRRAVLPRRGHSAAQRRLFAGFRGQDRESAEHVRC